MKKLLTFMLIGAMAGNALANEAVDTDEGEEKPSNWRVTAISPYVGTIAGVDIKFNMMYLGLGTNFMSSKSSIKPKYYVYDPSIGAGGAGVAGMKIRTETKEQFRVSAGFAGNKWSAGMHLAFASITPELPALSKDSTLGFGAEVSYYFWDNLFIKASATYFTGTDSLGSHSFYNKGDIVGGYLHYKKTDALTIGNAFQLGAAVGYRFNL